MKKIYNILFGLLLIVPSIFISCSDDYQETNLGDSPLVLSVSNDIIALDITAPQSNALTFEWTSGSNFNTNAAIKYQLELALSGTNFANSIKTELDKGTTTLSYKTEEINNILLNNLGIAPDTEVSLEARVTASVQADDLKPQISETKLIKITSYKPVSKTLYLIGDATPNGWNIDNAIGMNSVSGAAGGFVWQGKLNAGELKFITILGQFAPSYGKGIDDTKLYFRETLNDPNDVKFKISTTGIYKISLNIVNQVIKIEALDAPEYSSLWFVGGFSSWKFVPMNMDANDPFIFHYNAELKSSNPNDEFKIATAPSFDSNVHFLRPEINGQGPGTNLTVVKWSEDEKAGSTNDYKWKLASGTYKIKLDTRDMKIDIVPFIPYAMIYMVGDATPGGWSIDKATPLVATAGNSNKFSWTGTLNAGEMKFSCDKQSDWNGAWFLASQGSLEPTGNSESMIFSASGSNPDNKWKIITSGSYTIQLDQLQETITIKKN